MNPNNLDAINSIKAQITEAERNIKELSESKGDKLKRIYLQADIFHLEEALIELI